jgi:hypothetical protein
MNRLTLIGDLLMRIGMYEVREQLVHLAEGRFSLTGRGRYRSLTLVAMGREQARRLALNQALSL